MFAQTHRRPRAFTLIELLIVVAIIAVLAAIAVPNFLEAQTRAKVSRVTADMRSIATGLEAYAVDSNAYPPNVFDAAGRGNIMTMPMGQMPFVPYTLTTPVAYMTDVPLDTFKPVVMSDHKHSFVYFNATNVPDEVNRQTYRARVESLAMADTGKAITPAWAMLSTGPDQRFGTMAREVDRRGSLPIYEIMTMPMASMGSIHQYDPTNGTISDGDIVRFGP
ncbi:MAG: prepilin-type N-terminal cleavage/methylation domain-containing protein [Sumerlaeia bacterium]